MTHLESLSKNIANRFGESISFSQIYQDQLTVEVSRSQLHKICLALRDETPFQFNQLMDVCGVDYLHYGVMEWQTEATTHTGFSRGVRKREDFIDTQSETQKPRFAAVYHLLSTFHNHRLRLRAFAQDDPPKIPSVVDIWPSANWFEREAFDLFGIFFEGHPDLRRIMTDYGFKGHPFRKDFPVIGHVEMRYDAEKQRCVYEPVSIQPRTLVPKVIRRDARYATPQQSTDPIKP